MAGGLWVIPELTQPGADVGASVAGRTSVASLAPAPRRLDAFTRIPQSRHSAGRGSRRTPSAREPGAINPSSKQLTEVPPGYQARECPKNRDMCLKIGVFGVS